MKNELSPRGWLRKFRLAGGGICWAVRHEGSFLVHLPAALAVVLLAAWFQLDAARWGVLLLTIGLVWCAELLNTALEQLAQAIGSEPNQHIGRALDVSSGAVLVCSIVAVVVGIVVFWEPVLGG